mgnify:FL=1
MVSGLRYRVEKTEALYEKTQKEIAELRTDTEREIAELRAKIA